MKMLKIVIRIGRKGEAKDVSTFGTVESNPGGLSPSTSSPVPPRVGGAKVVAGVPEGVLVFAAFVAPPAVLQLQK